jgi:hypothetical protein
VSGSLYECRGILIHPSLLAGTRRVRIRVKARCSCSRVSSRVTAILNIAPGDRPRHPRKSDPVGPTRPRSGPRPSLAMASRVLWSRARVKPGRRWWAPPSPLACLRPWGMPHRQHCNTAIGIVSWPSRGPKRSWMISNNIRTGIPNRPPAVLLGGSQYLRM